MPTQEEIVAAYELVRDTEKGFVEEIETAINIFQTALGNILTDIPDEMANSVPRIFINQLQNSNMNLFGFGLTNLKNQYGITTSPTV